MTSITPEDDDDANTADQAGATRAESPGGGSVPPPDAGADAEELRVARWVIDAREKLYSHLAARNRELLAHLDRFGLAASVALAIEVRRLEQWGCKLAEKVSHLEGPHPRNIPGMGTTKTWVERFPHPGQPPAQPDPDEPITLSRADPWFLGRYEWNDYVRRLRQHEIARAVDELARRDVLQPEERIARNVGAMILDGTLWSAAANMVQP